MNSPLKDDSFKRYYLENFKDSHPMEYEDNFLEAYEEFVDINTELRISNEDLYWIPITRIRERGGAH